MERLQGCDETVIDANEAVIIQTPTAGVGQTGLGRALLNTRARCPLYPQKRTFAGTVGMSACAMCGRLRVGKSFFHVCSLGRCSHVFGL